MQESKQATANRGNRGGTAAALVPGLPDNPHPAQPERREWATAEIHPLSEGQKGLWFHQKLEPRSCVYNLPFSFKAREPLDPARLQAALNRVTQRHPLLRSVFNQRGYRPAASAQIELALATLPGEDEATAFMHALARRPFDLTEEPPLRAWLLAAPTGAQCLLLVFHHIALDGVSFNRFMNELARFYRDPEAEPPCPKTDYADFVAWQAALLASPRAERMRDFWRGALTGPLPILDVPGDRPRPPQPQNAEGLHILPLPAEIKAKAMTLAHGENASPFMVFLAAFHLLLARLSGQEDVIVGVPWHGRSESRFEDTFGYFVNMTPIRIQIEDDPSFRRLLARLKNQAIAAFEHADLPFPHIVKLVNADRGSRAAPIFQAGFIWQASQVVLDQAGSDEMLGLEPIMALHQGGEGDLSLEIAPDGNGLIAMLAYRPDLYSPGWAARTLDRYATLLTQAAEAPHRTCSQFDLLLGAERRRLFDEWAQGQRAPRAGGTNIASMFAACAARWPDRTAVAAAEPRREAPEAWTYAELDARAERVAAALRSRGVGPEDAVAVFVPRGPELMAALLGALKAGAAYLPLDDIYPAERLDAIMRLGAPAAVVASARGPRPPNSQAPLITLEETERLRPLQKAPRIFDDGLAYLIFTSGSTGEPKGVQATHAGMVNMLRTMSEALNFGPEDVMLSLMTVCFDASLPELFLPLISGGQTVIASREAASDGLRLARLIERWRPTAMNAGNATWRLLADSGWRGAPQLRGGTGGEPLDPTLASALRARLAGFANYFGPTEATVQATGFDLPEREPPALGVSGSVPIGRPLANCGIQLFDRCLQPVPPGAPGELCIIGVNLSRGYVDRPDLTAARFVPNPFAAKPGERLYRTGDLARFLEDGALEFLDRVDRQVKLRGYRIELAEIEAVLQRQDGVREAVVALREDAPGDPRLAAYLLPLNPDAVDIQALRQTLTQALPHYMIPAAFVVLGDFPRLPNGKVDLRALPRPDYAAAGSGVAPQTELEAHIAHLWAQLLGLDAVGVHDNFFHLGGHSLLATRLTGALNAFFGLELPLRAVFEQPTVTAQAALVEAAQAAPGSAEPAIPPLESVDGDQPLPLSFAQERLWFLDRLQTGGSAYNFPLAFRCDGPLSPAWLARALALTAGRHDALRAVFEIRDDAPVQRTRPPFQPPMTLVDLSGLPAEAIAPAADTLARAAAARPFDLETGPLCRGALLRADGDRHWLILSFHHIVIDGWSATTLLNDLALFYRRLATGETHRADTDAPKWRYADFAVWQRRWLSGAALERELAWWRERLLDPPALALPYDGAPGGDPLDTGVNPAIDLNRDVSSRLKALARETQATPFMALLAGYAALLSRYTGQTDLVIGAAVSGRDRPELQEIVGFFVNTLPLRIDLGPGPGGEIGLRELIKRVRRTALDAFAHQHAPLQDLTRQALDRRTDADASLIQALFTLQTAPATKWKLAAAEAEPLLIGSNAAKFDLTLDLIELDNGFSGYLEFDRRRLLSHTAGAMARAFHVLLDRATAAPDLPLGDIDLVTGEAREELLLKFNRTAASWPGPEASDALIFQVLSREPDRALIEDGHTALSRGETMNLAEATGASLRRLGVGLDDMVAVMLERDAFAPARLLGVWRAGAAYCPLDPDQPPERLAGILADCRPAAVMVDASLRGKLPDRLSTPVLLLNRSPAVSPSPPAQAAPFDGSHLAYMIFTSGSTGRPKGAQIPHSALVNFLNANRRLLQLSEADCWLGHTRFSFDLSITDLFLSMSSGAKLAMIDGQTAADGFALGAAQGARRATVMCATPSTFRMMLDAGWQGRLKAISGGEAMSPELAADLRAAGATAVNIYGPTETTVWNSVCHVDDVAVERSGRGRPIALGQPLDNTRLYLLDRRGRLVPPGAVGEICIGGVCQARGFGGRPDLTAARFQPDPFAEEPGARCYRSGDLGRFLPSGPGEPAWVSFQGRIDHQVKIRGHRIEPGEIETRLAERDDVGQALVLIRDLAPGGPALIAYLTGQGARPPEPDELRRWLARSLPEYMLPAAFVILKKFPLTPNGKLDRQALPAPSPAAAGEAAPRTPLEAALAELWAEALRLPKVGIHDNFFELGGHSLLATRLTAAIRRTLRLETPLRTLFHHPSVAALADALAPQKPGFEARPLTARPPAERMQTQLSPAQERIWFHQKLEPDSAAYNVPMINRLHGPLPPNWLARALNLIAERHETLRACFPEMDGAPAMRIAPDATTLVHLVDLTALAESDKTRAEKALIQSQANRPFALDRPPLARCALARLAPDRHTLALCVHHLLIDGPSTHVLFQELTQCWRAFARDEAPDLPALTVQFPDFAHWQRQRLDSGDLEGHLAYWQERLADLEPLDLPLDRQRPAVQTFAGAHLPLALEPNVVAELRRLGRGRGATLFMTLLAAYAALLARYSRQEDLAVGAVSANRDRRELEPLIGFFIDSLPLRLDLSGGPSFFDMIDRVRDATLDAFAHRDAPFQVLADRLHQERDASVSPLFQTMFTLQNDARLTLDLPGVAAEHVEPVIPAAKFDLSLTLLELETGIAGVFEYNVDLFEKSTIQRMARHYTALLADLAARPDQTLAAAAMLSGDEQRMLLEALQGPASPLIRQTLPQLFASRASECPDEIAVEGDGRLLTRAALRRKAAELAARLRRLGVEPETPVALLAPRTPELLIGLLGILEAGGCFVPLDPLYPAGRLTMMLEDARPAVVLTAGALDAELSVGETPVLRLDEGNDAAPDGAELAPPAIDGDCLAYMIFTSGSTGRPKGVQIHHRHIVMEMQAMMRAPGMNADDRVLAHTTVCFDPFTLELFLPLAVGARILLADRQTASDGFRLKALLETSGATFLQATPSAWRMLIDANWSGRIKGLCGGEALTPDLAADLRRRGVDLWNVYGPTETTVWCTACRVDDAMAARGGGRAIAIGQPVENMRVFVLDPDLRLTPLGAPAALFVGGMGVARGYCRRPDLTAERFVPHPYSDIPGERLYDTGDLARWLPGRDGAAPALEYLGRADHQVKLRGFRIELGEIEARLTAHEDVRQAVVMARRLAAGQQALIAYVRPVSDKPAGRSPMLDEVLRQSLRSRLKRDLPDYMVPGFFLLMNDFPLTENGKVNRKKLPAPAAEAAARPYEPPRTPAETALARAWRELFQQERIGRNDHFFELGGDSLMAVRMIAIARRCGLLLSPRQALRHPTLADLAAAAAPADAGPSAAVTGEAPLSPHMRWFTEAFDPEADTFVITHTFAVKPDFCVEQLQQLLAGLIERHDALRLRLRLENGAWRQWIDAPGSQPLPFSYFDLSDLPEAEREAAYEREAIRLHRDMSPVAGPVIRFMAFRMGAGQSGRLVIAVHHAVTDNYSQNILFEDIQQGYRQLLSGQPLQIEPPAGSYRQWALRLHAFAHSAEIEREIPYWLDQRRLGPAPLPKDFDRDAFLVRDIRFARAEWDVPRTDDLLGRLSREPELSVRTLLLAAMVRGYAEWSGQPWLRVDMEHHGRNPPFEEVDLSRTVGSLTTKHPAVFRADPGEPPRVTLDRVRHDLEEIPNDGLGFGLLRYCREDAALDALRKAPPPDIFFNYRGRAATPDLVPNVLGLLPGLSPGRDDDPVTYLLLLNSWLQDERLCVEWMYSRAIHREETMQRLLNSFMAALEALANAVG